MFINIYNHFKGSLKRSKNHGQKGTLKNIFLILIYSYDCIKQYIYT
jgi:hypothetical protein